MRRAHAGVAIACLVLACSAVPSACGIRPKPHQVIGRIIIPKIHVHTTYVEGTKDEAAVPGPHPVHNRRTYLPNEGKTVVISGHHFTRPLPGASGGVFLHLDQLRRGDTIYLTVRRRFGGGKYKYIVTSNRTVNCGRTPAGFKYCRRALRLMKNFGQNKVYLSTCIGDGYQRRIVTAFAAKAKKS